MIRIVANTRLPTEKANGLQTMKTAEALAARCGPVSLWAPTRFPPPEMRGVRDAFAYYGVARRFRIRLVPSIDLVTPLGRTLPAGLGRLVFYLHALSFSIAAAAAAAVVGRVFYSRDVYFFYLVAPIARALGKRIVFEAHHALPALGGWRRRALAAADAVVAITSGLAEDLVAWGARPDRVHVVPDAVDPSGFRDLPGPAEARRRLGLDPDRPTVVYTGHLYPWKGAETLLAAAGLVEGVAVVVVGGTDADRRRLAPSAGPARLVGRVAPTEVPAWLAAADALVLPNSARQTISSRYTSPLKLFEYLAAGRPIVASDLPSLREILTDDRTAVLVAPDDPAALAAAIDALLADPERAARLAAAGRELAGRYTWDRRAERLARILGSL